MPICNKLGRALPVFLCTLAGAVPSSGPSPALKPGDLTLQSPATLSVGADGSTAKGPLTFANKTTRTLQVKLSLTDFENPKTHGVTAESGVQVSFDGSDQGQVTFPPGEKTVLAQLSGKWQPGENAATMSSSGIAVGTLTVRFPRPRLDKISIPAATYYIAPGEPNLLPVRNDGDVAQALQWRLVIDGQPSDAQTVLLHPGETGMSRLPNIPGDWNAGILRDKVDEGKAEFFLPGPIANEFPIRSISLKVRIVRSAWYRFLGDALIFFLVFLGAAASYLVHVFLPNLRTLGVMKKDAGDLRARIDALSDRIDSRLRVLITVEKERLEARASQVLAALSPTFADSQAEDNETLKVLKDRLDHVEKLDALRSEFSALPPSKYPPKAIFEMESKLQSAADLLRQIRPSPGDLENARAILLEADVQMKSLGSGADVSQELVAEAKRLKEAFGRLDTDGLENILKMMPAIANVPTKEQAEAAHG